MVYVEEGRIVQYDICFFVTDMLRYSHYSVYI